jgi:hypothetical protein
MCGLVGMAGDVAFADRQVFRDMLDVCQLRGRDSTGVISINRTMGYGYYKNVGPPAFMFDRKSYETTIETGTHAALIGHCRAKTVGAATIENAHPFEFPEEGIIGVHNGTLRNYYNLDGYSTNKVDSEILYQHLAKHGAEKTFSTIEGAWACVWWDDEAETLNFIRNSERPLWFTWSEDRRKLFWASETWMFAAVERKQDLWKGPKDDYEGKFIQLPEDTLWRFKLDPNVKKGDPTLKMQPAKKIERYVPSTVGNGGQCRRSWGSSTGYSGNKGGEVSNPFQKLDDQLPVHLRPKQETLALIQGGKSSTPDSTEKSSTSSKTSLVPWTQQTPTTSGDSSTPCPVPQSSTTSQKTDRKRLTGRLSVAHGNPSEQTSEVSFRDIKGMAFITDLKTGNEFSEKQVEENTGGFCSFCDEPIGDLTEIAEFYAKDKFICVHCLDPHGHRVSKDAA